VAELTSLPTASQSDGENAVDEQEGIERVANQIEPECLSFLNGRVIQSPLIFSHSQKS
jgi:hypothetical protein